MNEEFIKLSSNKIEHVNEYIKLRQRLFNEKEFQKLATLAENAIAEDKNK